MKGFLYLDKAYKGKTVFEDFSLTIPKNQIVALLGRSGSGKTTLLNLLGGLNVPDAGEIIVDGEHLPKALMKLADYRRAKLGVIPQSFALLNEESAFFNIALPMLLTKRKPEVQEKVEALAKSLDIFALLKNKVIELSAGERQRVAIARALTCVPQIILADEPTSALDEAAQDKVKNLFLAEKSRGATIIFSSHNKAFAEFADQIVNL